MTDIIDRKAAGLLTTKEAAAYLSATDNSLRCMRSKGYGPPFHKIGSAVLYDRRELDDYVSGLRPSDRVQREKKLLRIEKEKGALGD